MISRGFDRVVGRPTLLGFGAMRLPFLENDESKLDMTSVMNMVDLAMSEGVNYFDTAYVYHRGVSESALKAALVDRYPRGSFYLADKMPVWEINKTADFEPIFQEQLKKCGVEYFDFYLLHALDAPRLRQMKELGGFEYMRDLKRRGLAKNIGFSFHDETSVLPDILDSFDADFVQLQINYLDWTELDSKALYETALSRGIPVVVMEPLRGGMLGRLPDHLSAPMTKACPAVSQASWGIRYCASLPGVLTVLSGMSTMDQLEDNLATMRDFAPLTEEEQRVLQDTASAISGLTSGACTQCAYCMPCPVGVQIPDLFRISNNYALSGDYFEARDRYRAIDEGQRADSCVSCGDCLDKCPQKIRIPEMMGKLAAIGL